MGIIDKITEKITKSTKGKEELLAEQVDAVKEEIDSENVKAGTKKAVEIIRENPEISAVEFLKMLKEEDNIPNEIIVDTTKKITDEETVEVVEELDFTSEQISEIIKDTDMDFDIAKKVVAQIPDEAKKEEQKRKLIKSEEAIILKQLDDIYEQCENLMDQEIIYRVKKINMTIETGNIESKINEIAAKMTAFECITIGDVKISNIIELIPLKRMLEIKFTNCVERQYRILADKYDKQKKKYRDYDKSRLERKIIKESAKNIAKDFDKIGEWDSPELETIKKLEKKQKEIFMKEIYSCENIKISSGDYRRLSRKIGMQEEKYKKLDDLFEKLENMPEEEREIYILNLENQIKENNKIDNSSKEEKTPNDSERDISSKEEYSKKEKSINEVVAVLQELSPSEAISVADIVKTSIQQRNEVKKVITPKVKRDKTTNTQIASDKPTGINLADDEDQFSL